MAFTRTNYNLMQWGHAVYMQYNNYYNIILIIVQNQDACMHVQYIYTVDNLYD